MDSVHVIYEMEKLALKIMNKKKKIQLSFCPFRNTVLWLSAPPKLQLVGAYVPGMTT